MPAVLLDSNLLILFIAGTTSRDYLGKHRRLRDYDELDFELLLEFLSKRSGIILTPNTLTEASNLVSQIGEPARTHLAGTFRRLVTTLEERYVESRRAAEQPDFPRLWLTDSALLHELANEHVLLTADFELFGAARRRGLDAVNFRHLRPE
jgi:hypothetical protein